MPFTPSASPAVAGTAEPSALDKTGPYAADPQHLWNRLHRLFYVRHAADGQQFGYDELDPLLWPGTEYLLAGPSHERAIALLDEFLSTHGERLIGDRLRRAVFQRDLWAVFDWSADSYAKHQSQRRELAGRLARALRRVALPAEQIRSLPDNLADAVAAKAFPAEPDPSGPPAAFLPRDLLAPDGSWVMLGANGGPLVASSHASHFGGRSVFWVLIRLPEGREATWRYLKELRAFPDPFVIVEPEAQDVRGQSFSHPHGPWFAGRVSETTKLPQFPAGTAVALVRQMVLIDECGEPVVSPLTESVQIRVYRAVPESWRQRSGNDQAFVEFRLRRSDLFAGKSGGLHAVGPQEEQFFQFMAHDFDPFEQSAGDGRLGRHLILQSCATCHGAPGVYSFLSRKRLIGSFGQPPAELGEFNRDWEERAAIGQKRTQYGWGLLQGLWQCEPFVKTNREE